MSPQEDIAVCDFQLGQETTAPELHDETADADYQRAWSEVMEKGPYKNPSSYTNCAVLLLCWEEHSNDLDTDKEVNDLKLLFETKFRYVVERKHIDNRSPKRLQVQANAIVTDFINTYDGPHTLLIVYYAGHGKPGEKHGDLVCFGQTTPNLTTKRTDFLSWNNVEDNLRAAGADVLEILDCCYASTLFLTRGPQRKFECLAACKSNGTTPRSGPNSFTTALMHALENLIAKNDRFTTVELRNEIMKAPHFPRDQVPQLSEREKDGPTSQVGRIMLHPLSEADSHGEKAQSETPTIETVTQPIEPIVTLHLDFAQKPTTHQIKLLGEGLNKIVEESCGALSVNGVRWGGMNPQIEIANRIVKHWKGHIRSKRASMKLESGERPTAMDNALGILTPPTIHLDSPRKRTFHVEADITLDSTDQDSATLVSDNTLEVPDEQTQDSRKKRKLSLDVPTVD